MPKTRPSPIINIIETLEPRLVLSVTPLAIGRALDLLDGTVIATEGNPLAFGTYTLGKTGQFLGFPSGGDGDFLVLSTGIASHITALGNTADDQGTDLGPDGTDGDAASVGFTLPVPVGGNQRLKIDFMFLSEEFPEFRNAGFDDTFTVSVNGVNVALNGNGDPVGVDHAAFVMSEATFLDGRTDKLTLSYAVPDGVTSLDIVLRISDAGDGALDSAAIVDNVRFESPQLVYLDFDGASLGGHFAPGVLATLPAFTAADLGLAGSTQDAISDIVSQLQAKFAAYDIEFTTTEPGGGEYATIIIGGDNGALLDISSASPLLKKRFPGGSPSIGDLFNLGGDSMLGFADAPDVGNLDRSDFAVIFAGEFDEFFAAATPDDRLTHLVLTTAHELAHNLGLRHVADQHTAEIMKHTAPRDLGAVFGDTLVTLDEQWSDGAVDQNSHSYLLSVLGKSGGTGLSTSVAQNTSNFSSSPARILYNVTLTIGGADDGSTTTLHFDRFDGSQNIPFSTLPAGANITLTGASTLGGALDIFSGTPVAGDLTDTASAVPLFDANGNPQAIPLTKFNGTTFAVNGTLALLENDLGNVTILTRNTGTFTDADGDTYTVRLIGPGKIGYVLDDPDHDGKGGLARLVLDDTTTAASTLIITVKKCGGDGRVSIGEITGASGAGLKALTATTTNITGGGIIFDGALGAVTIRDLADGADITGGAGTGKTIIRAHAIGDGSDISIGTNVTLFQAARIGDSAITAPVLTKLLITGDRVLALAGDFGGQLNSTGALASLTAHDLLGTTSILAGGGALDRTTLILHDVLDGAVLALASTIASLKAATLGDADISAQRIDSVTLTGDFAADLTATGRIGKISARDFIDTASVIGGGTQDDRTALTFREIRDGAAIDLDSTISLLRAAKIGAATIDALALTTLQVRGDARVGLSGDFAATLTLDGGNPGFKNVLTTATIAGAVSGATIRVEGIGTFTAAGITGSTILAGFTPTDANAPFDGGTFADAGAIKTLTIRGTLANSVIATKSLGTITATGLATDNGGTAFGVIAHIVPARVAITGFTYDKAGPADQSLGDFHVKLL